jgi:hypothetical protein
MGKQYQEISQPLREWIEKQKMFFVATAPLSGEGHINCSPKGLDSFRIITPTQIAYQDLTGSGIETVAHIKENGRIVIMFCAFEGPPKILRLHGTGQVIEMSHPDFDSMGKHFSERMGVRAYIRIDLTRISESCGYSIPLYKYEKDRDVLDKYIAAKGEDGLKTYRAAKNLQSIDGIGGLEE